MTTPKPEKPSPDFPLFAHARGRWAKKIDGKTHYFGRWDDPAGALQKYIAYTSGNVEEDSQLTTVLVGSDKPAKPHPDFPLFPHASKQWAKKIRGKTHYFGHWDNPQAALEKYLEQRDDLLAGRPLQSGDGLTVRELVNLFLTQKQKRVETGYLEHRTWVDYDLICKRVLKVFGPNRQVESLRPADFEKLRAEFATTHGPVALSNDITRVKVLFNYASKQVLIDKPVQYGEEFKRPSKSTLRKAKLGKAPRMFTAGEVGQIIDAASVQMKAMVLLGVNCGFGNNDCVKLTLSVLDLENGWVNFGRPKTGIPRRCPLWPETVEALKKAIEERYSPRDKAFADRVFITKYKTPWEPKSVRDNPVSKEMGKILKTLDIQRKGVSFYALRHVFQTIGEKTRDKDAVKAIMGHVDGDISAEYSEEPIEDARLKAVTEYVRDWLFSKTQLRQAG